MATCKLTAQRWRIIFALSAPPFCVFSIFIVVYIKSIYFYHSQTCFVLVIFHNYYLTIWSESVISDLRESDSLIVVSMDVRYTFL